MHVARTERKPLTSTIGGSETAKEKLFSILFGLIVSFFLIVLTSPIWVALGWYNAGGIGKIYLTGVISYWLCALLTIPVRCIRKLSIYDRNMAQLGLTRNVLTGEMEPKINIDYARSAVQSAFGFGAASLLSWAVYPLDLFLFLKRLITRFNGPTEIKRLHWIIRHHLLGPLDVVRFDIKMTEAVLGRKLLPKEYEQYQRDMNERDVKVNIEEILEIQDRPPR